MKKIWNILLFAFFTFCLFLFKPRQDVVFTAINTTQYILLFEEGQDFELCLDENNFFTGTYSLSKDTVYLLYREHVNYATLNPVPASSDYRKALPGKLYINQGTSQITSAEDHSFSAIIHKDLRQKLRVDQNIHILAARPEQDVHPVW